MVIQRFVVLIVFMGVLVKTPALGTISSSGLTKTDALQNAHKAALKSHLALIFNSIPDTTNRKRISDAILGNVDRFIVRDSILPGTVHRQFGFVRLEVVVVINSDEIRKTISSMNIALRPAIMPRLMIIIQENLSGNQIPTTTALTVFNQQLLKSGFRLFDKAQLMAISDTAAESTLARQSLLRGADYIIIGSVDAADAESEELYGQKQYFSKCRFNARIIRSSDATVISSISTDSKAGSSTKNSAVHNAIERAAGKAARFLSSELLLFWAEQIGSPHIITLIAYGIRPTEAFSLAQTLGRMPLFLQAVLRYCEDSVSHFEIAVDGTLQSALDCIATLSDFKITEYLSDRISIKKCAKQQSQIQGIIIDKYRKDGLEIAAAAIEPLYPCACATYRNSSVGKITILNNCGHDIVDCRIEFSFPHTAAPVTTVIRKIPVKMFRNVAIPLPMDCDQLSGYSDADYGAATATFRYTLQKRSMQKTITLPTTIYGRNSIDWSKPEMISAFITPMDATIKTIAHQIAAAVSRVAENGFPDVLLQAAGLYHLCKGIGIRFIHDPNSFDKGKIVDQVSFPIQTLSLKGGDCDDTSVLFASLLESIGIETALLLYPGHVVPLFNTGVYSKNGYQISYNSNDYLIQNGMVWIPIETTRFSTQDFWAAWKIALDDFRDAQSCAENQTFIEIHKAWNTYPALSAAVQSASREEIVCPTSDLIISSVIGEMKKLKNDYAGKSSEIEKMLETRVDSSDSGLNARNRLGILHARTGSLLKAQKAFGELGRNPLCGGNVHNNMGNVLCLLGQPQKAVPYYLKAIQKNGDKPEYLTNLAFCFFILDSIGSSLRYFHRAFKQSGRQEIERITGINLKDLGISEKTDTLKEVKRRSISRRQIRLLIKKILDDIPNMNIKSYSKNILPVGNDPSRYLELKDIFWWQE